MATKIKDAAVVTSKYNLNGQDKSHWTNVGAVFQNDDGSMFLSLNAFFNFSALPRKEGSERVIIGLFEPKKRDGNQNSSSNNSGFSSSDSYNYSSGSTDADLPPF